MTLGSRRAQVKPRIGAPEPGALFKLVGRGPYNLAESVCEILGTS